MELISKLLFWVANSLLIPDIIILLCLFVRSLILIGGTYNMYMTKRKNDKALDQLIKDARIDDLKAALPDKDNSLYMGYLRDLLYHPASADYSDFLITKFENEAEKDVSLSKMLAKIGPVLGLIGTLISMSPALVGLSTGDISGMAYNMQVVFATTVVGLVISAVGLISMQFKQRWYAKDVNNLDYVSRVLNETTGESKRNRRVSKFLKEEDTDPLSVVVNLFDVAMVFAVALMVAMVMHMNMTEVFGQEDFTIVKNPGKENMEIISKEGKKINTYKPSGQKEEDSGKRGRKVGIAYELDNGEIIYVPE